MSDTHKINCTKCNGIGKLQHYSHLANGDCFQCKGRGYLLLTDNQLRKLTQDQDLINQREEENREAEERYEKELRKEKEINEQRKKDNLIRYQNKLSYYGVIGEKVSLTLKEKFVKDVKYGRMYVLTDNENNQFVFYSKESYFCKDLIYEIEATIKEHKEVNGYKQTVLKNVKVLNHIDTDELSDEELMELFS